MGHPDIEQRIFDAALDILRTRGPLAVSIESIAAASGVAKTTIYRRFENRDSVLEAAIVSASPAIEAPESNSAKDTVRWVLSRARFVIENVVGRGTVGAIISDADPRFTSLLLGMIRSSARPLRDDLRERSRRGEIKRDLDVELAISLLLGVVVAEIIRGRVTDDEWVETVLALVWPIFEV